MVNVILVTEKDKVLGTLEKFAAHKNPVPLHRAISVVVFDPTHTKILLQQRPANKPTWPLFWSNTCCTHPFPDETYHAAATRRLQEEMGFSTELTEKFRFTYAAQYDEVWGEHELDVVFVGQYSGEVKPDTTEVADYKWMTLTDIQAEMVGENTYTPWWKIIFQKLMEQERAASTKVAGGLN